MTYSTSSKKSLTMLYGILGLVIIVLLVLIGWFIYLLTAKPESATKPSNNNTTVVTNLNTNANKNKNKNGNTAVTNTTNTNTTNTTVTNTNSNSNTDTTNANTNTNAGLVEPDSNTNTASDKKTVTLYFPKTDASCGQVTAVQREITPADDLYGQIILEDIHGPTDDETGYTTAIPSGLRLRLVESTANGPVITVNETYDTLSDCAKQTVDAQLIKTANSMFELPETTAGQVVVGTVDTNTNTNQ